MHWYNGNNKSIHRIPVRYVDHKRTATPSSAQSRPVEWLRNGAQSSDNGRAGMSAGRNQVAADGEGMAVSAVQEGAERQEKKAIDWKDMALRLQADIDNFRRRQMSRADEAIAAERERLLRQFLPVADNLRRALNHEGQDEATLREGLELVYRQLMRLLEMEGVIPIEAVNQSFDPEWHAAITMVPAPDKAGRVIEEIERGYKLNDKLLRPAQVVVAG